MKKTVLTLLSVAVPLSVLSFSSPLLAQAKVEEAAKSGRVATEVFGRKAFLRGPRISPDGSKIVFMMGKDGRDTLAYIDLTIPNARPKLVLAANEVREAGDRSVVGWRWVGNKTIVATLQSREIFFGERGDVARLIAFNIETSKLTPLAWDGAGGNASTILHTDDAKETILLQRSALGENSERWGFPEVVKVDVNSGKFTYVMRTNPQVGRWIADGKGVIRAASGGSSNGKNRLMYRSSEKDAMTTVSNEADATFSKTEIRPQVFLDEPDMAYTVSNKDGFDKVYKVNMKTLELSEPLFESKGYDAGGIIPNKDRNGIIGYIDHRGNPKYLDEKFATVQKFLDEDYGKNNASIYDIDDNFTNMIVGISKPNQMGGVFHYDIVKGDFRPLGFSNLAVENTELNKVAAKRYKARDGLDIEAIVTYPRHRKEQKNLPVIVLPHGGPFGARDSVSFDPWAQSMAESGYVVIQPNYRGSGGYGRQFVAEGRKPDGYGMKMQDDLNDAVSEFAKMGLIDPKRACIMGWSYGGYAAARGAQRDPSIWKCAIAGAGIYDLPMMKAYDTRAFGEFGANYQASADDIIAISSARHTKNAWSPILIVAALRDARIPIEQSRTLVSRLKSSGKKEDIDFRYIEQPKGTHNLPYEDVYIQWLEESEKWAQRFNPAYIATDPDKSPAITIKTK